MAEGPPNVRALLAQARAAGHDALGVAHDPEAWVALAELSREQFWAARDVSALERWGALVADVAEVEAPTAAQRDWLVEQLVMWHVAAERCAPPAPALDAVAVRLAAARRRLSAADPARGQRLAVGLASAQLLVQLLATHPTPAPPLAALLRALAATLEAGPPADVTAGAA